MSRRHHCALRKAGCPQLQGGVKYSTIAIRAKTGTSLALTCLYHRSNFAVPNRVTVSVSVAAACSKTGDSGGRGCCPTALARGLVGCCAFGGGCAARGVRRWAKRWPSSRDRADCACRNHLLANARFPVRCRHRRSLSPVGELGMRTADRRVRVVGRRPTLCVEGDQHLVPVLPVKDQVPVLTRRVQHN